MTLLAVSLPWGAPVSYGYLASLNVAAVYVPYVLIALAVVEGAVHHWSRPARFPAFLARLVGAMLVARYALVPLVRMFVQTVRPYAALGFDPLIPPVFELSFPSGHVAVLSAVAFATWKVRPAVGAALLLGAVLVGIARVFAGVHWPADIVGGIPVGYAAAAIALNWERLFARRPRR